MIGGNAVAVWVATRDESLVRATRDVDILVLTSDLVHIRLVLEADGFLYRHASGMDMFLERPEDKDGDKVHLVSQERTSDRITFCLRRWFRMPA